MKNLSAAFHRSTKSFAGQLIFILAVFTLCRIAYSTAFYYGFLQSFEKINHLLFSSPPSFLTHVPFYSGSIILSSLLHPYFLLALLLLYLPFLVKIGQSSQKLATNAVTIIVTFGSAFILVWELCTYNYNFYLNNPFFVDRIVLITLALLLLRFPLVTPLFIAFAYVYRSQFNFPLGGFELFDKRLLFDILVMHTVFMYAKLFVQDLKIHFLFLVFCIVASNYFMSGVEKIIMSPHGYEWLIYNDPADLFTNVHYRGWMARSDESTVTSITNFLENYGILFQFFVLLFELGAIFLLRSRKLAITLLVLLSAMHIGIFIFGSMLFWKWIAIDILLAYILFRNGKLLDEHLFTKQYFKASLVIILLSTLWLRPIMIGWHDTPFNQYFTYEVEDKEGKIYALDKNEMNPYHQWFQYDHFAFLVNKAVLPISGFGYSNKYKVAAKVKEVGPEGFLELEKEQGKNNFKPDERSQYEKFIKAFFKNKNEHLFESFFWNRFSAPHHLYSGVKENAYLDQAPVKKFRVIFNQVYTQNRKPIVLNKQVVDEVVIN